MGKSDKTGLSNYHAEECLPPWMQMMRNAARNAVQQSDVEEIVKAQVEKAKKGDRHALQFVFEQLLGGNELKGATFVQNVFHDGQPGSGPHKPTKARPGSDEKIELMGRRIASRNGAFHTEDGPDVDLS